MKNGYLHSEVSVFPNIPWFSRRIQPHNYKGFLLHLISHVLVNALGVEAVFAGGAGNRGYYQAKRKHIYSLLAEHQLFGL